MNKKIDYEKMRSAAGSQYPPTNRQIDFAYHYALEGNGMMAVRKAGFNHSTPGSQSSAAHRLLQMPKVQALIAHFKGAIPSDARKER